VGVGDGCVDNAGAGGHGYALSRLPDDAGAGRMLSSSLGKVLGMADAEGVDVVVVVAGGGGVVVVIQVVACNVDAGRRR